MMHTHFSDDENSDDYSGSPFPSNDTGTSTSTSLQSESQYQANVQSNNGTGMQPTIALFGAGSKTATHFMRLALDAGYHVRALLIEHEEPVKVKAKAKANAKANTGMGIETTGTGSSRITAATGSGNSNSRTGGTTVYRQPPPSGKVKIASHIDGDIQRRALALREEFADQTESLCWIPSETIFDTLACQRVLREADYVVCMMDDSPLTCFVRDYKSNNNTSSSNYNNDENYDPVTRATKTGRPQNKSNSYQDRHAKASTGNITSGSASERPYDKVTPITSFLQILYPLMKDVPSIQVILFQVIET